MNFVEVSIDKVKLPSSYVKLFEESSNYIIKEFVGNNSYQLIFCANETKLSEIHLSSSITDLFNPTDEELNYLEIVEGSDIVTAYKQALVRLKKHLGI